VGWLLARPVVLLARPLVEDADDGFSAGAGAA